MLKHENYKKMCEFFVKNLTSYLFIHINIKPGKSGSLVGMTLAT